MRPTFTPLHPVFAAECSGVDISGPVSPENAKAIEEGMITLRGSGLRKISAGITSIEEVLRETVR